MINLDQIKKYKQDIFLVSILFLIFFILLKIFWGHLGDPIVDCGREAYIPLQMLKGKVLYKDIFINFTPLSYQLNAFLYWLAGPKLNTLYLAGTVNTLIILTTVYLIAKNVTNSWTSWVITILIISVCVFRNFIHNYIFPYSYGVIYALSFFLLAILFCIYYIKNSKPWFFIISVFFMSLSILFKYEYIGFITVLAAIALFFKPISKKYILASFISLIIPFIISFSILFYQGLTVSNLTNSLHIIQRFSSTKAYKFFLAHCTGFSFSKEIFLQSLEIFIRNSIQNILYLSFIIYFFFLLTANKLQNIIKYKFTKFQQFLLIVFLIIIIPKNSLPTVTNFLSFSLISFTTVFILLFFLYRFFIQKKNNLKDKIFLLLILAALTGCLKSFFCINLDVYGTFFIPLLFLVNTVFIVEYLPEYFQFLDKNLWQKAFSVVLLIISVLFCYKYYITMIEEHSYPIKTSRGTLYTSSYVGKAFESTNKYILKEIPENKTFLMLPEGPMLNFLTNRDSNNMYFTLHPAFLETFGEEKVIKDLSKNMPDYIFINPRNSSDNGAAFFCKDYAFKICDFILEKYKFVGTMESCKPKKKKEKTFCIAAFKKK